jgi:hypothetical protein
MAIGTFRTTFCAALATLAALPALASSQPPAPGPAAAGTTAIAAQQAAATEWFDSASCSKPVTLAPAADGALLPYQHGADLAVRPSAAGESQPASMSEPGNLPLLGAAGIALLIAQLRRSRRPTVR